ncbi:MAG: hypothetical protein KBA06_00855 [Saprospiraceae bacterium]|nr:hypothetical protein [Saprospiraceae bacterium]
MKVYSEFSIQYKKYNKGIIMKANSTLVLVILLMLGFKAEAQISGFVFQDYNENGVRDLTSTINAADGKPIPIAMDGGIAGIIVNAYDNAGTLVGTATSLSDGSYSIAAVSGSLRLEFTNIPTGYFSTVNGTSSNTSVQFVTAPATDVNFGINRFQDYSQNDPMMVTNAFIPLSRDGVNSDKTALLSFQSNGGSTVYWKDITATNPATNTTLPTPITLATHNQIGSTWGLAYQRSTKTIFAAAFVKQFTDLGPGGTGAIYKIDYSNLSTPTVNGYIDLNAIFGPNTAGTNPFIPYPDYNITADRERVQNAVLINGLGDIDISEDEKKLFVLNLYDRKIYTIPVDGSPINNTTITVSPHVPVQVSNPYEQDTLGTAWAMALAVHNGKTYVVVHTGLRKKSDGSVEFNYTQSVNVHEYDPITNTFSNPVFTGEFTTTPFVVGDRAIYDMIFDKYDNMVFGARYYLTDKYGGQTAGYLIRACPTGTGTWTSVGCTQLPYEYDPTDGIATNSLGGLAQIPGFPHFMQSAYDLYTNFSTGSSSLNSLTGEYVNGITLNPIYSIPPTAGVVYDNKSAILGDLEVLSDLPPIEIGNRVWLDSDEDGVQDPGEAPLQGITVQLLKNGSVISTATTDAQGRYIFSNDPLKPTGTSTDAFRYDITQLMPDMAYTVHFPTLANVSGSLYSLTTQNSTTGTGVDEWIDSDANSTGDVTILTTDIPTTGANNHTFDVGYKISTLCSMSDVTATPGTCNPVTNSYDLTGSLTFVNEPTSGTLTVSVSGGGSQVFNAPFTSPLPYNITGLSADGTSHTVTAVFSADATCTNTITYTAPVNCYVPVDVCNTTSITAQAGTCDVATNRYTLTGQINFLTAPTSGTITIRESGGGSVTLSAPFTNPLNYTISNLYSDGLNHVVNMSLSTVGNCTNSASYTAPVSCSSCFSTPCGRTTVTKN